MTTVLLPTAYFPSVPWVHACIRADEVVLEAHEHFVKQTLRNRASIYGANGRLDLTIPMAHTGLYDIPISQAKMLPAKEWKKIHWRSLVSAYARSPYFDFYEQELSSAFHTDCENLFEWNLGLLRVMFSFLHHDFEPGVTTSYQPEVSLADYRNFFNAKEPQPQPAYPQVFSDRHGFIPGLSVLDLLFNTGKDAASYLQRLGELS